LHFIKIDKIILKEGEGSALKPDAILLIKKTLYLLRSLRSLRKPRC
jgi:hypothetical protein